MQASEEEVVALATRAIVPPARVRAVDGSLSRLTEAFGRVPVAAVIRRAEDLPRALASQVPAIFFVRAPAFHLGPLVWAVQARHKMAFVHLDLIAGLGKDRAGVTFLAREIGVNGIITSHSTLIAAAKAERVLAMQRLLLHDDLALSSALSALDHARPDIVEVLPGMIFPLVKEQIRARLTLPIIVGGFVSEPSQRDSATEGGALAISTSTAELWP
jgi:glycerol uptake operon antiterminator